MSNPHESTGDLIGQGGLNELDNTAFFNEEEKLLNDISGSSGFTFKRGQQWSINPETGEAQYDPKFFEEKGYTPSQALFAAIHEIKCHLVETAEMLNSPGGEIVYRKLKDRENTSEWVHIWDNCRTDAKGNLAIMRFAPALSESIRNFYRDRFSPASEHHPKHLQFIYTVLRNRMLPDDEIKIDPEVDEEITKLRNFKGKDVIALATDPALDALLAQKLSDKFIEPVINKLYEEDKKNRQNEQNQNGKSQQSEKNQSQNQNQQENKGEPSAKDDNNKDPNQQKQDQNKDDQRKSPEKDKAQDKDKGKDEPFAEEYKAYWDNHPEPMKGEDVEKIIKEFISRHSIAARQAGAYGAEHGVSKKEIADYYQEYLKVEHVILPLREIFKKIVEERKTIVRRLESLKDEGVMIDPGLVVQTYLDLKAGIPNPKTMEDFVGQIVDEPIPGKFALHLVADQSGSMGDGIKEVTQRRTAIATMESLKELADALDGISTGSELDLDVQTDLRSFGVEGGTKVYKPLSKELTEKQRIDFFKGLLETPGGTNDYDVLAEIENEVKERIAANPSCAIELKNGKTKEIVIVLSDGDSANASEVQKRSKNLREMGIKVIGLGMTSSSASIRSTYAPDGLVCPGINELPKMMGEILAKHIKELSILGKFKEEEI